MNGAALNINVHLLAMMWGKVLAGIQISTATMKMNVKAPQETETRAALGPSNTL